MSTQDVSAGTSSQTAMSVSYLGFLLSFRGGVVVEGRFVS